jgi:hypothetical protein
VHSVAGQQQLLDDMRADEAGRPRDRDHQYHTATKGSKFGSLVIYTS